MFCLCSSVEQGLDSAQETLRSQNRSLRLWLRHMCCAPIIPNIAYFKKPVQILALFLAQFPRLDKSLMNRSNDPAMLAEIQTPVEQNRCGSVKGCIIRPRRCKIVVAFDSQIFSRLDRLLLVRDWRRFPARILASHQYPFPFCVSIELNTSALKFIRRNGFGRNKLL